MSSGSLTTIETTTCQWLARGQLRDIYQHPEIEGALIKVIRADRIDPSGNVIGWSRRKFFTKRRFGIYVTFQREFREMFRAARYLYAEPEAEFPFACPLGVVRTERGLGLVVEKATAPDGSLAPSIKQLIKRQSFTERHRAAVKRFFDICTESHFVFGDLNPGNLVFVENEKGGRVIAIDGIGEKALFKLHEMSSWLNARKLRRMEDRLNTYIRRRVDFSAGAQAQQSAAARSSGALDGESASAGT